jgi:hypothetical protein
MSDALDCLKTALAGRYTIGHELGSGGMARRAEGRYGGAVIVECRLLIAELTVICKHRSALCILQSNCHD